MNLRYVLLLSMLVAFATFFSSAINPSYAAPTRFSAQHTPDKINSMSTASADFDKAKVISKEGDVEQSFHANNKSLNSTNSTKNNSKVEKLNAKQEDKTVTSTDEIKYKSKHKSKHKSRNKTKSKSENVAKDKSKEKSKPNNMKENKLNDLELESPPGFRVWSWFMQRKPFIPKERTYKDHDELIYTEDYHEAIDEQLQQTEVHRYESNGNNHWTVTGSDVLCVLKQDIPKYGYVEFRQGVAQPLEFSLFVINAPAGLGNAHIRTEPPPWQHYAKPRDLGIIEVESGKRAVTASSAWSRRLLMDLSEGMRPVLRYWDAADASDDMEVIISAMNFEKGYADFDVCISQLIQYDYNAVQRTVVYFHEDSSKLRKKAKNQIDEILEILAVDSDIVQIDLEVYSHNEDLVRYNFRLSTRRLRAIRDYFIAKGIDEDKLIIKIFTKSKKTLKNLGYNATDVHIVLQREKRK